MSARTCLGCETDLTGRQRKWCSDRCRRAQYGGTCKDCGHQTSGSNGRKLVPDRCIKCERGRHEHRGDRLTEMWQAGIPTGQIAEALDMKPNAVHSWINSQRSKKGAPLALRRRRNREDWQVVKQLREEGLTYQEIGDVLETTDANIGAMLVNMRRYGGHQETER